MFTRVDDRDGASSQRLQFSIGALLGSITSVAILFAAAQQFGAFGFVFGGFLLMIAIGGMLRRRHWQIGGASGALGLLSLLWVSWLWHGDLASMDYRYIQDVKMRFHVVESWLEDFRREQGEYPEDLLRLVPADPVWIDLQTGNEAASEFTYQRKGASYELTYLGEDRQVGGERRDADISQQGLTEVQKTRVSFRAFLHETPGSGGLNFTLIVSLILALAVANAAKDAQPKTSLTAVFVFTIAAIIVGVFMAGFHIAAAQSGH